MAKPTSEMDTPAAVDATQRASVRLHLVRIVNSETYLRTDHNVHVPRKAFTACHKDEATRFVAYRDAEAVADSLPWGLAMVETVVECVEVVDPKEAQPSA